MKDIKQKKGILPKIRPKSARLPREAHRMLVEQYRARMVRGRAGVTEQDTTSPNTRASDQVTRQSTATVRGVARYAQRNASDGIRQRMQKAHTSRTEKTAQQSDRGMESSSHPGADRGSANPTASTDAPSARSTANSPSTRGHASAEGMPYGKTPAASTRGDAVARQTVRPAQGTRSPHGSRAGQTRARNPMSGQRGPMNRARTASRPGIRAVSNPKIMTKQANKAAQVIAKKAAKVQAQAVKIAAKRAAQTLKAAIQMTIRIIKMVIKAVAALVKSIAAMASGGVVFVIIMLAVMAVVLIFSSPFGLFYADENPENQSVASVIATINAELHAKVQEIATQSGADKVVLDYEGDSGLISNWPEVLAVFAVKTASDNPDGMDVVTMDEDRIERLRQVCWDMNRIDQRTATEVVTSTEPNATPAPDGLPTASTQTVLYISIQSKSASQQAVDYGFTPQQTEMLDQMLSGEFRPMLYAMLGVDPTPGLTPEALEALFRDLPAGMIGNDIVRFALEHLGDPYSKRDCSSFTRYCYAQFGIELPRTAADQGKFCVENNLIVSPDAMVPGDLIFFSHASNGRFMDITHVGLFAGDGMIVDSSSSRGQVVFRKLYSGQVAWGRPHLLSSPQQFKGVRQFLKENVSNSI